MKKTLFFFAACLITVSTYSQYETPRIPIGEVKQWARYGDGWLSLAPRWMLDVPPLFDSTLATGKFFNGLNAYTKFTTEKGKRWEDLSEYERRHYLLGSYHKYTISLKFLDQTYEGDKLFFAAGAFRNHKHYHKDMDGFIAMIKATGDQYEVLWLKEIAKLDKSGANTFDYAVKTYYVNGMCLVSVHRAGLGNKGFVAAYDIQGNLVWETENQFDDIDYWDFVQVDEDAEKVVGLGYNVDQYTSGIMPLTLVMYETLTGKLVSSKVIRGKGYPGAIWLNSGNIYAAYNFNQFYCEPIKSTLTALATTNVAVFRFTPELSLQQVCVYQSEEPYIINQATVYPDATMMYGIAGKSLESLAYYHPNDPNFPNGLTFALSFNSSDQVYETTSKYPITMKRYTVAQK